MNKSDDNHHGAATPSPPPLPTFSRQSKETGNLLVWSGALRGEFDVKELATAIPFRKNTKHGYTDREIWQQKSGEQSPEIVQQVGRRTQSYLQGSASGGSSESTAAQSDDSYSTMTNYANYYADGSSYTFLHRDYNCNPNEFITLACFGTERKLVFCSCTAATSTTTTTSNQNYYIVIPLSDGSIIQFDGLWNTLHYHKVLKEMQTTAHDDDNDRPRVSIQWYEPRDEAQKWDSHHLQLWEQHNPNKKHIQQLKRRVKKDLERSPSSSSSLSAKALFVDNYIPEELQQLSWQHQQARKQRKHQKDASSSSSSTTNEKTNKIQKLST